MAISPKTEYPSNVSIGVSGYPEGKAKNDVAPGDGTGTPLEADWVNDVFGIIQAILVETGATPTGNTEKAGDSQVLKALKNISGSVFPTRAALLAATARKYVVGQTIWVGGYRWLVFTGGESPNTQDVLTLPDGNKAQYQPFGTVHAEALGYAAANSAAVNSAIITRCFEIGTVVALPAGVSASVEPFVIPAGNSLVSSIFGKQSTIIAEANAATPTISLSGSGCSIHDLALTGTTSVGMGIEITGSTDKLYIRNLSGTGLAYLISSGSELVTGCRIEKMLIDTCTVGMTGTGYSDLVITDLNATFPTATSDGAIEITCLGSSISGSLKNVRCIFVDSTVTLYLRRIEGPVGNSVVIATDSTVDIPDVPDMEPLTEMTYDAASWLKSAGWLDGVSYYPRGFRVFTGTSPGTEGTGVNITTDIPLANVQAVSVLLAPTSDIWIPPNDDTNPVYLYQFSAAEDHITIVAPTGSSSILSKPLRIAVNYSQF